MGVQIETLSPGDGSTYPKQGQTVVVHYTGTLTNGQKFDSSRDRGSPFKFKLGKGEVIRGWDEGVAQLSIGQRAKLICSPDYAYGSRGHPGIKLTEAIFKACEKSIFSEGNRRVAFGKLILIKLPKNIDE